MPKIMLNGIEYASGIDHQKLLKIGDAPLDTTADNLSDAINEIKQSLSQLVIHRDTLSGTTDNSGRLFSNYDISNKLIIALLPTEHGKIADQVRLTGNTLCIKYLNSDSMSPYNNQSVTCNFYYVSADLIVDDN